MGGLSLWHWLIVLVVVVLVFGTKRLRNVGQDMGEAVKGFRKGMREGDAPDDATAPGQARDATPTSIETGPNDPNVTRPGADRDPGQH